MATLELQTETKVNAGSNLSFYCYVTLKDSEQILIDLEETEWTRVNGNFTQVSTGVLKKVRLEGLNYQANNDDEVVLYSLGVRGFKKDGGLRFRDEVTYYLTQKTIEQIPDSYHEYARKAFTEQMWELTGQLNHMMNKGVKIGN